VGIFCLKKAERSSAELRRQTFCLPSKRRAAKDLLILLEFSYLFGRIHKKSRRRETSAGQVELEENKRASGLFYPVICSSIPSLNQNGLEAHYLIYREKHTWVNFFLKIVLQIGMLQIRTTLKKPSLVSRVPAGLRGPRPSFLCLDRGPSVLPRGSGVRTWSLRVPAQGPH